MKNKQVLIKLATLRLAINHVLRQRMVKQAFWPFSSKPKYRFQTDPDWQDDPEAVKEFLQQENSDMDRYMDEAYFRHKWFPTKGPALKLQEKNPDLKFLLANKHNIDLNTYSGDDRLDHNNLLDVFPKEYVPLKKNEQQMLQDYITARNSVENELGPAGEALGPEQAKYYLNKGVRGLADIDDWLYLINARGDRGEEAFATEDFYNKEDAVRNLIERYREKFTRLPSSELKTLLDYAALNNKYLDADTTANVFDKDFFRILKKDVTEGGKDTLRDLLATVRADDPKDSVKNFLYSAWYDDNLLPYEQAMRKDPSYEGIKQKMLELGKKYNL